MLKNYGTMQDWTENSSQHPVYILFWDVNKIHSCLAMGKVASFCKRRHVLDMFTAKSTRADYIPKGLAFMSSICMTTHFKTALVSCIKMHTNEKVCNVCQAAMPPNITLTAVTITITKMINNDNMRLSMSVDIT